MPRAECTSSMPCASLVILATPPATVTRGTGWSRMYFSMPPTKSPMSMSCDLVQGVQLLRGDLGGVAGGAGDMGEPHGAGDVDAAMDGVNPGRAGIGMTMPGRSEDRDAAQNAEARVERALGHRLAAGHGDLDLDVGGLAGRLGDGPQQIILRGTGLMAGSPGGIGRPGRVTRPTPSPRAKVTPEPALAAPHSGGNQRAVGDVGIVAGVLDDRRRSPDPGEVVAAQSAKATRRPDRAARSRQGRGIRREAAQQYAALAAAAAQAPVVQPRFRGRSSVGPWRDL